MKPKCNIAGIICEYDMSLTQRNAMFEGGYDLIGYGSIDSLKGKEQEEGITMKFFFRKSK